MVEHLLLQIAVNHYSEVSPDTWAKHLWVSELARLEIHQPRPLIYQSSIALRLARALRRSPQHIAQGIVEGQIPKQLAHRGDFRPSIGWLVPHILIAQQGEWIQVSLTASGVAQWLHTLTDGESANVLPLQSCQKSTQKSTEVDFRAIHAYARCCSILRLSLEQGLIGQTDIPKMECSDVDAIVEASFAPKAGASPIPWLAGHRLRAIGEVHQMLLQTLIKTLDDVAKCAIKAGSRPDPLSLAYARGTSQIGRAFEAFHRECRPLRNAGLTGWSGSGAIASPQVASPQRVLEAQAELGLVRATQQALGKLLTAAGIVPPPIL
ncbi:MAG: hypothetical protein ACFB4J_05410 [Elainellaceae cyanobacterium]